MTVCGGRGSQVNNLVASNNGTALAANTASANSLANESVSVMIFGTATIGGANGTAGGGINAAATATLTVNTGTVVINLGGNTYNLQPGAVITFTTIANGGVLQYSSAVDLSGAAATPVTVTNGTFTNAAPIAANSFRFTTANAPTSILVAQSVFGGSDVTTSANATTASATIGGILAALNTTIVKLNAMDSSLNGYRDNISDTIRELGTTVESMQSTDVTDAMSDIARAQQEISYSMAVWQVQRKEENEAVRAMLSTVAG